MSKIIIADDHSTIRLLLKKQLQLAGYEIALATNGVEAWELVKQLHPALILCDWMMPKMDGIEVCRHIKADPELARTFLILLTSKGEVTDRVAGLDAGADDFLSKPVEPNELLARVRAGIRLYNSQQQLIQTNQQLNQTLQKLKRTQTQLIQSEKMSSLGQLVAGIAHEINNPVTFIEGNLVHASNYIQDLIRLAKFERNSAGTEIKEFIEEIDLDFLIEDLPKVLNSMEKGAQRIGNIVVSLRNFSRLDEADMKKVNIHEGLDSTLLILQSRLSGIEVTKKYGKLPKVECYPGQLNQVFMNILNNAIDVLDSRGQLGGSISISTSVGGDRFVNIEIANNGPGIKSNILPRIFEPFFTTKPVGAGKGLGLSISYSIVVEKHHGNLECFSEEGKDTVFVISIPIHTNL